MNRHKQSKIPGVLALVTMPIARKSVALALASGLLLAGSNFVSLAQVLDRDVTKRVQGQVAISRDVAIAPVKEKVSLNMRDASLRDVLNMLAEAGRFNLILDESVDGTLTVDIKDISINKALEYIFTVAELSYTKDGNTVIIANRETANQKNLNAKTFKAIPVQYKSAQMIADALNSTLFRVSRPGGSTTAIAAADPDSNSLLIMGTETDIKLVGDALRELDVPRKRKVYKIKHSDPSRVMNLLGLNFFQNNVIAPSGGGSSGSSGSASSGSASGSTGSGSSGGGASGSSGASGSTGSGSGSGSASGSTGTQQSSTFTAAGVTMIADPISATLTVMATDEQMALIDSVIDELDVRRPQAAIEVSLVEIQNTDLKTLVPDWTSFSFGRLAGLDLFGDGTAVNQLVIANPFLKQHQKLPRPDNFTSRLNLSFQNQNLKGKILANPTVVTLDGTSANISITDQVPTISQSNTIVNGVQTITTTISTQNAGVTLTLVPRIFNDGSVELNLQPNVSQPIRTVQATNNGATSSTVLLATRSLNLAGVRVKDGQTLVIGGLLREASQLDVRKVPGLDKLPIVSAMFRSTNTNSKERTELVLMVTPHVLKDDAATYFSNVPKGTRYQNPNQGGIQPVALPKFIGSLNESDLKAAPSAQPGNAVEPSNPGAEPKSQGSVRRIEMEAQPKPAPGKSLLPPKTDMMPLRPADILHDAYRMPIGPEASAAKYEPDATRRKTYKKSDVSLEAIGEVIKN